MKDMMATLGARLLETQHGQSETEIAVEMRHSGDHASLRTIAQTIEQQLTWSLRVHAWWLGGETLVQDVDAKVELNKQFLKVQASPEEVKTLLTELQADAISYETFYARLQAGGWTREGVTAEEEQQEIKTGTNPAKPEAAAAATHDAAGNPVPPDEATHDAQGNLVQAPLPPGQKKPNPFAKGFKPGGKGLNP
jgi:hypothetical protein